jgi:hypothetical protein
VIAVVGALYDRSETATATDSQSNAVSTLGG